MLPCWLRVAERVCANFVPTVVGVRGVALSHIACFGRFSGPRWTQVRLGPALGEQDLRIPDDKSQTAGFTQLWTRPSVRCVPQVHGWMTLVERHPTIYLRAEKSNVAETELGKTMALRS